MKYIFGLFFLACAAAALLATLQGGQAVKALADTNQAQTAVIQSLTNILEIGARADADLKHAQAANLRGETFLLYAAGVALLGMGAAVVILALAAARTHRNQAQTVYYLPQQQHAQALPPGQSIIVYPAQSVKVRTNVQQ